MLPFGRWCDMLRAIAFVAISASLNVTNKIFRMCNTYYANNECKWRLDKCHTNEIHFHIQYTQFSFSHKKVRWGTNFEKGTNWEEEKSVTICICTICTSPLICIRCFPISKKCQTDKEETCCCSEWWWCLNTESYGAVSDEKKSKCKKYRVKFAQIKPLNILFGGDDLCVGFASFVYTCLLIPLTRSVRSYRSARCLFIA